VQTQFCVSSLVSAGAKRCTHSACSANAVQSRNPLSLKRCLAACRCSGVNHCSFRLTSDYAAADDWGPGVVFIKYACINREFCFAEQQTSDLPGWTHVRLLLFLPSNCVLRKRVDTRSCWFHTNCIYCVNTHNCATERCRDVFRSFWHVRDIIRSISHGHLVQNSSTVSQVRTHNYSLGVGEATFRLYIIFAWFKKLSYKNHVASTT
jgi:hypothetical protein